MKRSIPAETAIILTVPRTNTVITIKATGTGTNNNASNKINYCTYVFVMVKVAALTSKTGTLSKIQGSYWEHKFDPPFERSAFLSSPAFPFTLQ